jgi:hypothetical protein
MPDRYECHNHATLEPGYEPPNARGAGLPRARWILAPISATEPNSLRAQIGSYAIGLLLLPEQPRRLDELGDEPFMAVDSEPLRELIGAVDARVIVVLLLSRAKFSPTREVAENEVRGSTKLGSPVTWT